MAGADDSEDIHEGSGKYRPTKREWVSLVSLVVFGVVATVAGWAGQQIVAYGCVAAALAILFFGFRRVGD